VNLAYCLFYGLIPYLDVAVALTLRGKDGKDPITQDVMATFSPEILADDNADHMGKPPCSLQLIGLEFTF
jgi:hypothetical protein